MRKWVYIAVAILFLGGFVSNMDNGSNRAVAGVGCGGGVVSGCAGIVHRWTPIRNIRARRAARIQWRQSRVGCGGTAVTAGCSGAPVVRIAPVRRVIAAPVRVLHCVGGVCR